MWLVKYKLVRTSDVVRPLSWAWDTVILYIYNEADTPPRHMMVIDNRQVDYRPAEGIRRPYPATTVTQVLKLCLDINPCFRRYNRILS